MGLKPNMKLQFSSPSDSYLELKPIPRGLIFENEKPGTQGYLSSCTFGVFMYQETISGPFCVHTNIYVIQEESFLHCKSEEGSLQFVACIEGESHLILNEEAEVHIKQGQFNIFYLPKTETIICFKGTCKTRTYNIFFPVELLEPYKQKFPIQKLVNSIYKNYLTLFFQNSGWLTTEMLDVITSLQNYPQDEALREFFFEVKVKSLLFYVLFQMFHDTHTKLSEQNYELIKKAKYLIESHTEGILTVEIIASAIGMSALKLRQGFKSEYGIKLSKFITQARMNTAKYLLLNTNLPIKRIAEISGYSYGQNFTLAFRNIFGLAPNAVRKRSKNE